MGFVVMGVVCSVCLVFNRGVSLVFKRFKTEAAHIPSFFAYNKKMLLYSILGIGFIAVAKYWLDFVKWLVLIMGGIIFIANIYVLIASLSVYDKDEEPNGDSIYRMMIVSSLTSTISIATVLVWCMSMNFGWF